MSMKSGKLLRERRFGPFFAVQFFGAFNDNLFKQALIFLVGYRAATESESGILMSLAAGLLILPFMLLSPLAGQITDKYEKSRLIRLIKFAEIWIMLVAVAGIYSEQYVVAFTALFFMGAQSAFFGPVKYSMLPQVLGEDELIAGNGLIEMGTFLAILLGTIAASVTNVNVHWVTSGMIVVALAGWLSSLYVPPIAAGDPNLKIKLNPIPEVKELYELIATNRTILLSVLGNSWFWFFGAVVLSQLTNYTKYYLYGDDGVVTLLLATFSISMGLGSILCEKLSGGEIEIGLVPFGALGMSWFSLDLFLTPYTPMSALVGAGPFWDGLGGAPPFRVVANIFGLGLFGSFFIVPLYALIQHRSDERTRSRIIAGNNIFNAVFMVAATAFTSLFYALDLSTVSIFIALAVLNAMVCLYIFTVIPEFSMRFFIWLLASTIYRLRYEGRKNIPRHGSALLVANHVSYIDWFIITAVCNRPVRFIMYHKIYKLPILRWIFRAGEAIPIAPASEDAALKEAAFIEISRALRQGDLVCIFPEGTLTSDGKLVPFRPGLERILANDSVPVIPLGLRGLWGSFFSRRGGKAFLKMPTPSWRRIEVKVGAPEPSTTTAKELEQSISRLLS